MKLVKEKKSAVVYNGIESNFHPREESRKFLKDRLGVSLKDAYVIGSIGRLAYPKNYEFLIGAASTIRLPKTLFVIIGSGPELSRYRELIKKNNLEKRFLLAGEIKNAGRYIRAFDLFVLPSIYEGLSLTAIEAVSAGLPALLSASAATPKSSATTRISSSPSTTTKKNSKKSWKKLPRTKTSSKKYWRTTKTRRRISIWGK